MGWWWNVNSLFQTTLIQKLNSFCQIMNLIFVFCYLLNHFILIISFKKNPPIATSVWAGKRVEWEGHVISVIAEGFSSSLENVATRERWVPVDIIMVWWWATPCSQSGNHGGHAGESNGSSVPRF